MSFEAKPFHASVRGSRRLQVGPPSRSIDQRRTFKLAYRSFDEKRTAAGKATHGDLLPSLRTALFRRIPQSSIEIQTRDAGCGRIDRRMERAAIQKYPRANNTY